MLFLLKVAHFLVNKAIKFIQSSEPVDTYIVKQYIFSCKFKSVQKLDFLSSSKIIAGRFLVRKFMMLKNANT